MSETRITLPTWDGRAKFQYEGSVHQGTTVYVGRNFKHKFTIKGNDYASMLAQFSGQEVSIGTSFSNPPKGSLGEWLKGKHSRCGTSYVGPILISEGFAERGADRDRIRVRRLST
ncbi:MAG: hypothetical protein HY675_01630 [Chloroflexi bacterium]|nr:hypothetical protein [Chloroflexota bacterium]